MRVAGVAVLSDVEGELEVVAARLDRATGGATWWRGAASDQARRQWSEQARHLRTAAAALAQAQQALQQYAVEVDELQARMVHADQLLETRPLDELYVPGAAERAQAARVDRTRAQDGLEQAARRLAAQLAGLEAAAGWPAAGRGPCAPPPPGPPARGWARVAEVVFGAADAGLFDPAACRRIPMLEAGGGSGILRGLARKKAAASARERLISDAAQAVLGNKENAHAFKHADQLFGRKNITKAQRQEWARLIGAGLQSTKTFPYRGGPLRGVGYVHRQYGRYWVVVQDPTSGIVRSTFMPTSSQLGAILRTVRGS